MIPGQVAPRDEHTHKRRRIHDPGIKEGESDLAIVELSFCDHATMLQEGRQLDFSGNVCVNNRLIRAQCLADTGASATAFIDPSFVKRHRIPSLPLSKPCRLKLADGHFAKNITQMARVSLTLKEHIEELWCLVTPLGRFDLIMGMPWLELHDPRMSFKRRSITFDSDHCTSNCLSHHRPVTLFSKRSMIAESETPPSTLDTDIAEISAYAYLKMSEDERNQVTAMWPEHFEQLDQGISNFAFTTDVAAVTPEDYEKFFQKMRKEPMTLEQLRHKVPKEYHSWIGVWNPSDANKLPPHRPVDHAIELKDGAVPPAKRAYGMSREQALAVKEYIDEMLGKGFIRRSTSPYAAPVLIVKKPDGGLRICIDYRALNALTIRNRNAPPLIKETLARLCSARIYSKFDVIAAFNEVRMKEGHEEKTAFLTRYGLFEYTVMPFGLCNAPSTFQAFINDVLRQYLDEFCSAYLDDILIYSNSLGEHIQHVGKVLSQLQSTGLFLDINKCEFHVTQVKYLGLIITTDGLKMDPQKIESILEWKQPRCVKDVQAFLGFANFYRRFIKAYSTIAAPLTRLTKADNKHFVFPWAAESPEQRAFQTLKTAFTTAPILAHFDPDIETWLETDASDYVVAAVLSQKGVDGIIRPVAFMSKRMAPAECNYEIYDKELLAIIRAFEEWHPELAGTLDPIHVITDHKNLEYFMSSKQLNRRQARWAEFLAEFNFKISYRPGRQGTKPDSLTRRVGDLPEGKDDERHQYQYQTILKSKSLEAGVRPAIQLTALLLDESQEPITVLAAMIYNLSEQGTTGGGDSREQSPPATLGYPNIEESQEQSIEGPAAETDTIAEPNTADELDILQQVRDAYELDDLAQQLREAKRAGLRKIPFELIQEGIRIELGDCEIIEDLLYVSQRLYVPDKAELKTEIVRLIHEAPPGGHAGRSSTYDRVSAHYYWPGITNTVARYVKSCHTCKRSKAYREGKQGLLKPLPIPDRYFQDIAVDFITPLPICERFGRKYQHIMVVVDRLSKKRRFAPLDSLEVEAVVQAFIEWVWREEGYPSTIVSDRGTQFTSHFWTRLCQRIGTKPKLSTAFHPETDGQSENANAALKQYLRAYVSYYQDNWVDFLPIAEFEANSDRSASTGVSPFMATKGYIPRSGLEPPTPWEVSATQRGKRDMRTADAFIDKIEDLRKYLQKELKWAQALQTEYANRRRQPAPEFRVGDRVMLDGRNIPTTRPNKSLDFKNLGPFTVIRAINNTAYELDLPQTLRGIFPVFHPWLLHLDNSDPLPGQQEPPPPPVHVDEGYAHYVAEEIIDSKIDKRRNDPVTGQRGCLMYKIKYKGFDDDPEWQPFQDTAQSADLVADFHHKYPEKEGPHGSFQTPEGWEPLLAALFNSYCRYNLERPSSMQDTESMKMFP